MTPQTRRLSRAVDSAGALPAPVRLLHLGVGNFFRAHQAYYTQLANAADVADPADPAGQWGYAAFTGRSTAVADDLAPQDGLYTLIVKHAEAVENLLISALSEVYPGGDVATLRAIFASPELAVVTCTVTEAGYRRNAAGGLDLADAAVAADIAALAGDPLGAEPSTAPGKLVAGLLSRRAALGDGAKLAVCPCDNVPDNGAMVARVVRDLAAAVDPALVGYIDATCAFVTTTVDRITPRTTDADRAALAAATGIDDPAAVVTEPFSEWVLQGDFPAGRPAWETAGARFVDDIHPYEQRKLWLLNGSHSLMAYAATMLGIESVYDAIRDPRVRGWVEQWWDVAAAHLPLPAPEIADYRAALIERYENPNIRHLLAQIAADGSQKIAIRIVPALLAELAGAGDPRLVAGATRPIAAWMLHLRGLGAPVTDAHADEVRALVGGSLEESVAAVLDYLGVRADEIAGVVLTQARELEGMAP